MANGREGWRDRLGRWMTPVASRVTISANAITVAAVVLNVGAAGMLMGARSSPPLWILGAFTIALAGLLDVLDGMVARLNGQTSRLGDFLDHFFDRVSDLSILIGWTLGTGVRPLLATFALLAVMLNGYIATQIEATFGHRSYVGTGRGEYLLAAVAFPILQFAFVRSQIAAERFAGLSPAEWLTTLVVIFALVGIMQRFGAAVKLAQRP